MAELPADAPAAADLGDAEAQAALTQAWPALLDLVGPLYVARGDGYVLYANQAFRDILWAELIGDGDRLPETLVRRVASQPDGLRETQRVSGAQGTRVFEGRHRPVPTGGAAPLLVGAYSETTKAQEALANVRRLRARHDEILSTVSDWVWELDADWTFQQSSTRRNEVLGFDPTFLLGESFFEAGELLHNPRAPRQRPLNARRRAPFEQVLYRLETAETGERLFELSAIPKFDEETGEFAGFQGSARNVSEEVEADRRARDYRAELEVALRQLRDKNAELDDALGRAQTADRAKNEFLAMVGHELRTPLNAVIGFSELMESQAFGPLGNERYAQYVDDILGSSRHLLGVINDIIDVVKLELHEIALKYDEIDVPKLLETSLSFVREKATKDGLTLRVDAPEGLPPLIADPQKTRQMLVNLLGNAVKFTPAGGRVTLSAAREGPWMCLIVADTGTGIPEDKQQLVMQPFKQADGTLARAHEGLGLGLPLTRQLAETHGGTLELDSAEGEGTTFTIRLPLEPDLDHKA